MNTNVIVAAFTIAVTVIIWFGTTNNDESWTGNRNVCVGECYEAWKAENGGSIADIERVKQEALAALNRRQTTTEESSNEYECQAFTIAVTVIIWFGTTNNDESWLTATSV